MQILESHLLRNQNKKLAQNGPPRLSSLFCAMAFLEQCERPVVPMANDPGRVNLKGIVASCRGHHGRFFAATKDSSGG